MGDLYQGGGKNRTVCCWPYERRDIAHGNCYALQAYDLVLIQTISMAMMQKFPTAEKV